MSAQSNNQCRILSPENYLSFVQGGSAEKTVKSLINTSPTPSVKDVKTISYQELAGKQEYQAIKNRIDTDTAEDKRNDLKILIFPAQSTNYGDQKNIQEQEIFFINYNKQTYMTTASLAPSKSLRSSYLHIKGAPNEPNAQIVGDGFVIAGHADDTVVFKIPWKQEWGSQGLPESNNVNGFNTLYKAIQQQNQTIETEQLDPNGAPEDTKHDNALLRTNYDNRKNIEESLTTNINATTKPNNVITLTCVNNLDTGLNNENIVLDNIEIDKNQKIGELKNKILMTNCHGVNNQGAKFTYTLQADNIKANDFVICTVNENGIPTSILDDNTPISVAFNNNNANYVIVPKVMHVNIAVDDERMDFFYPVIVNINNKYEFNNQNTLMDYINQVLRKGNKIIDDGKTPIPEWFYQNGWQTAAGVGDCFLTIGSTNESCRITTKDKTLPPVPMPVQTYNSNSHFVRNYNIWRDGKRQVVTNVQGLAQLPFVPVPVVPLPVRPPVVHVPVVPVQQSGGNRPRPNTLYKFTNYDQSTGANWGKIPTLNIPNNLTYQQFIDNQIKHNPQNIAYENRPFSAQYRYVDKWGFMFTSDRPIYKDVKGNLVTLGNAAYEPLL